MAETFTCGMWTCKAEFEPYEEMRKSANGDHWCKKCQDEFDDIDWEEVYMNDHSYYEPPC